MGESSESQSSFRKHWEGFKEFWEERFYVLHNYSRFAKRDKPFSWSDSDVREFIVSDPLHGPILKAAGEAVNFGLAGSVIGAV